MPEGRWHRYATAWMDKDLKIPLVLAALIGGGGTAVVAPKVAPGWYRPDPARGSEMRALREDVDRLQEQFNEFNREGPREVRASLDRITGQLNVVISELRRMDARQRP